MRVAVVHSFYRSDAPSGENQVVERQVQLLRQAGHDVLLVSRTSDDVSDSLVGRARLARRVAVGGGADPTPLLLNHRPDVIHVHNLFPNFATSWLSQWQGPLVATLHNFRSVCANGVLMRAGDVCTLCPDGDRWAGVRHRCYRSSSLATLPIAVRNRRGIESDPLLLRADRIVVLSELARDLFVRFGLPGTRLDVVPNGVPLTKAAPVAAGQGCVAFGRLTAEKNWTQLAADWPTDCTLDVFGGGPLADHLPAVSPRSIRWRGALAHDELLQRLPTYRVAVFSGINPEGAYPLAAVEAWAAGLAVVARAGGTVADMVDRWGGGAVFREGSELPAAIARASQVPVSEGRRIVKAHFSDAGWLAGLEAVYARAVLDAH